MLPADSIWPEGACQHAEDKLSMPALAASASAGSTSCRPGVGCAHVPLLINACTKPLAPQSSQQLQLQQAESVAAEVLRGTVKQHGDCLYCLARYRNEAPQKFTDYIHAEMRVVHLARWHAFRL